MHVFDSEFNRKKHDSNMNRPCTLDFMILQIIWSDQGICLLPCNFLDRSFVQALTKKRWRQ